MTDTATSPPLAAVQALRPDDLCALIPGTLPEEARKLVATVHRYGALPKHAPPPVRRETLRSLRLKAHVPALLLASEVKSALDPFVKYGFESPLGGTIETVRIPLEKPGRFTVCVSSQIGCALGCTFCATGRMGLVRNLKAWEIIDQVRMVRQALPPDSRVHGVVFQGMGEPLSNLENVIQAARVMSDPCALSIDARCITICTAGLPPGIAALARALPNVRLAISLGSLVPDQRRELLPIDKKYPLEEVLRAVGEHTQVSGHSPLWAYTLLAEVNDTDEHAAALAHEARRFAMQFGVRPRISLIPYNPIGALDPYRRSEAAAEARFIDALRILGVPSIRRYSGGSDVGAACGQLSSQRLLGTLSGPPRTSS